VAGESVQRAQRLRRWYAQETPSGEPNLYDPGKHITF